MPNQPRTKNRVVRVNDELWEAAQEKAASEGKTLADVIRESLRRYVRRSAAKKPTE